MIPASAGLRRRRALAPTVRSRFPTLATTGPVGTLTAHVGVWTTNTHGFTVTGRDISLDINVNGTGVLDATDCQVYGGSFWGVNSAGGATAANPNRMTRLLIGPPTLAQDGSDGALAPDEGLRTTKPYIARACRMRYCNDGAKIGTDCVLIESYLDGMYFVPGGHVDGIQATGSTNVRILHNTIIAKTQQGDHASAAVILGNENGTNNLARIEGNYVAGGAQMFNLSVSNTVVRGNVIEYKNGLPNCGTRILGIAATGWVEKPANWDERADPLLGDGTNVWCLDNVRSDTGEPITLAFARANNGTGLAAFST